MNDDRLAKIATNGEPNTIRPPGWLAKRSAKVGHQHHRRVGIPDKIQDTFLRRRRRRRRKNDHSPPVYLCPHKLLARTIPRCVLFFLLERWIEIIIESCVVERASKFSYINFSKQHLSFTAYRSHNFTARWQRNW